MSHYTFRELANLTSESAREIDREVLGLNYDSKPFERFKQILSDSQIKDTDNAMTIKNNEFYMAIYEAVKKGSNKGVNKFSELALEMKLLRMELDCASDNQERGILVRSMLLNLSESFFRRTESIKRYSA